MAKVVFAPEMQRYTEGAREAEVSSRKYQDLVAELSRRFPALTDEMIRKHGVSIDGAIVQMPLLETFKEDSELVFIAKIYGG